MGSSVPCNLASIFQTTDPKDFRKKLHEILWHGVILLKEVRGSVVRVDPFTAIFQKVKVFLFGSLGAVDYTQTDMVKHSVKTLLDQGVEKYLITQDDQDIAKELALSVGLTESQINAIVSRVVKKRVESKGDSYVGGTAGVELISESEGVPIELAALKLRAKEGDRESMLRLARRYDNDLVLGVYGEEAYAEAAKWYHRAAELGDVDAMLALASMRLKSKSWDPETTRGVQEALRLYRRAAEAGSIRAILAIAGLYLSGAISGISPQEAVREAVQWYNKGAGLGSSDAMYKLALLYEEGKCSDSDGKSGGQAIVWYERAAGLGDSRAMYNLARLYERGLVNSATGAEALEKAVKLYQDSAVSGNVNAMIRLSQMYESGKVPGIDAKAAKAKAKYWNSEAVSLLNSSSKGR